VGELALRFVVGGAVVSVFALLGDLFRPKSFAGVFAAAPSVALTTLGLAAAKSGLPHAALEARSMLAGAAAFFVYATVVCRRLARPAGRPWAVAARWLWLWFAVAAAAWAAFLRAA
jgi:hypothetical protein